MAGARAMRFASKRDAATHLKSVEKDPRYHYTITTL